MKALAHYFNLTIAAAALAVAITANIGCKPSTPPPAGDSHSHEGGHDDHADHGHDHTAPHGGHLIELGHSHEYHAELVDDHEAESIAIHILDAHMKPISIAAESISLILTVGDDTQSFELVSQDSDGTRVFVSTESDLMKLLDQDGATGKLRVTIGDRPFSGTFSHQEHDHSHGDHEH